MAELSTYALPLLPLTTGVVLPHMVVTLALETDEARAAADASGAADGRLLLVPKIGDRYATVGTVAEVDEAGDLPDGNRALILRGLHRAHLGGAVAGTGNALWVEAEPVGDPPPPTPRRRELAREFKALVEGIATRR